MWQSALLFFLIFIYLFRASFVAQRVKNLPAVQETWVPSLGWEDHLEKELLTHASFLGWSIPRTKSLAGSQRVGPD